MPSVKLPVIQRFDTQMTMQISTHNADVSVTQELQKNLSNTSRRHGLLYDGKHKNGQLNKSGQTESKI